MRLLATVRFRVTVQRLELPELKEVGLQLRPATDPTGTTVKEVR